MEDYSVVIRDLPEEERPRERLVKYGPASLATSELLAIILRVGTRRESAIRLAERMLKEFKSLRGVATAPVEQLSKIPGIGVAKATQIQAAFELGKRLAASTDESRPTIRSPQDVAGLVMESLRYQDQEHFQVLFLDGRNQVLHTQTISVGILNANLVHPREVFRPAISRGCAAIIVVHNHPSGDPTPSKEDAVITKRLVSTGETVGIAVLDHIIIGGGTFVSMKEKGLV
jgi:DNA repair protein RadC